MSFKIPTDRETSLHREYRAPCHAMQSGVKYDQELGASPPDSPKHLRVGVNISMVEMAALVELLEAKGVLTAEDFWEAVIGGMKREVERYEKLCSEKLGGGAVKFG